MLIEKGTKIKVLDYIDWELGVAIPMRGFTGVVVDTVNDRRLGETVNIALFVEWDDTTKAKLRQLAKKYNKELKTARLTEDIFVNSPMSIFPQFIIPLVDKTQRTTSTTPTKQVDD